MSRSDPQKKQESASADSCDPEALLAVTIARLPDRFADFASSDLDEFGALLEDLREEHARALEDHRAILDRLRPEADHRALREIMADAEFAEFEAVWRRLLASERAQAAWAEWERRIGVPWPVPKLHMTMTEDPDGSLVLIVPDKGG